MAKFKKTLYSWWRRKIANPASKMDDFVQHVFQEHNQEVDLLANMVAEGQKKTVIDRCSNSESWKAVKGQCQRQQ